MISRMIQGKFHLGHEEGLGLLSDLSVSRCKRASNCAQKIRGSFADHFLGSGQNPLGVEICVTISL